MKKYIKIIISSAFMALLLFTGCTQPGTDPVWPDFNDNANPNRDIFGSTAFYGKVGLQIDDFEDGDLNNAMGVGWTSYTGGYDNEISFEVVSNIGIGPNKKCLHINYTLGTPESYGPEIAVKVEFQNPAINDIYYDFTKYDYVHFWMKGNGKSMRVIMENNDAALQEYDDYQYVIDSTPAEWREYFLPLNEFAQSGFGTPVSYKAFFSEIIAIQIKSTSSIIGEAGDIYIDQISVLAEASADDFDTDYYYGN